MQKGITSKELRVKTTKKLVEHLAASITRDAVTMGQCPLGKCCQLNQIQRWGGAFVSGQVASRVVLIWSFRKPTKNCLMVSTPGSLGSWEMKRSGRAEDIDIDITYVGRSSIINEKVSACLQDIVSTTVS